ncbi:hypothetical protein TYRP_023671 [Tyrophagus putrescentiae]|nr:hypothetical protein TYRP_023671 [Tyrophagus putrescentiae]
MNHTTCYQTVHHTLSVNENRGEYVWIGGAHRASVGPDGQYQWEDNGSKLTGQDEDSYTNWAPTGHPKKNLTDHCVQMAADEGLEGVGGRMNDAPRRTSPSACQRTPPIHQLNCWQRRWPS